MVSYIVCIQSITQRCLQNNGYILFRRESPPHVRSLCANVTRPQGSEILFRIAIALLEYHSSTLLKMDLEDMIKVYMCVCVCACVHTCVFSV